MNKAEDQAGSVSCENGLDTFLKSVFEEKKKWDLNPTNLYQASIYAWNRTNVAVLCEELGVTRSTLYRHVSPSGELRGSCKASAG